MIFSDAHLHTNPVGGMGAREVARRLRKAGGWFMAIAPLLPHHYNLQPNLDGIKKAMDITIRECEAAREEGVECVCLVGVHPAVVDQVLRACGDPARAYEICSEALRYAAEKVREGRAVGIGEVGRQHYPVDPVNVVVSEMLMEEALAAASDLDAIVHLHLERGGAVTARDVAARADRAGMRRERVIIHHADARVAREAAKLGLRFTVVGRAELLGSLGLPSKAILVESDFLDDPRRPGAVMYPWSIPEEVEELLGRGVLSEDDIATMFIDNVCDVYGVVFRGCIR
ncbi:hydrolase TatD [Candidatus Geothermarchaeota archaeon ex4572_27]|nr:MAG: hydrolase TatD [Candidatus Geothermarchaeota archaeon ex4572_27]